MGLRRWIFELLDRGDPPEVDPHSQVEVAIVALYDGPRLVAELESYGVDAVGIEAFDIVTNTRSRMRVVVRRGDLARAQPIADRFR